MKYTTDREAVYSQLLEETTFEKNIFGVSTDRNGLYYMRARYYDQDIKRFINRDVVKGDITDSKSLNRYSYVQGNPVSLTDPFGLCPDPNSRFKSLCMAIYHTDWNTVGHTVLSVAGIFWEGADAINAVWYALEGNTEMALSCALSAIPGAGMAVGNLLMKSQKLSSAGRAIHTVSKLTQGGMGIGAGIGMAASGFGDFATGLKNGQFDGKALARGLLGVGIAALSGRNVAGTAKSINKAISNAGTPTKNPGGWGDISGAPVGMGNPNIRSVAGEMSTYRVPGAGGSGSGSLRYNLQFFASKSVSKTVKTDFYVTPAGDAIPTSRMQFEQNLSLMNNVDGKYVGESSRGPVRIRIEEPHPLDENFNGDWDSDHFIEHIHIEHRKNGITGPWGKGWNNKTTIPLDWIDGDD